MDELLFLEELQIKRFYNLKSKIINQYHCRRKRNLKKFNFGRHEYIAKLMLVVVLNVLGTRDAALGEDDEEVSYYTDYEKEENKRTKEIYFYDTR